MYILSYIWNISNLKVKKQVIHVYGKKFREYKKSIKEKFENTHNQAREAI